ncbi:MULTISPECIES: YuiB family protein [unclassified Virgibacillus]|uniref:YuiB family protein n=1 Tax=unclassified Virgibacillus TaxID=2620237 RepID=UPI0024DEC4D5|nr:YuiB family protein [Virgibacillus sp. LDC-1]
MAQLIQIFVSTILFFVIFFGIAFILNMLLRRTWLMTFLYPIIVLIIVDDMSTTAYFKAPGEAFSTAFSALMRITPVDIIILSAGLIGTIVSGIVIKILRKNGYQMF